MDLVESDDGRRLWTTGTGAGAPPDPEPAWQHGQPTGREPRPREPDPPPGDHAMRAYRRGRTAGEDGPRGGGEWLVRCWPVAMVV